jgi:hypothetical protein
MQFCFPSGIVTRQGSLRLSGVSLAGLESAEVRSKPVVPILYAGLLILALAELISSGKNPSPKPVGARLGEEWPPKAGVLTGFPEVCMVTPELLQQAAFCTPALLESPQAPQNTCPHSTMASGLLQGVKNTSCSRRKLFKLLHSTQSSALTRV